MKKSLKPLLCVLVLAMSVSLIMVFSSGGCRRAEQPVEEALDESEEEPLGPGILSPGQIDSSMIDQVVKVRGKVLLVIQNPGGQGGLSVKISGGGGEVAVRIEDNTWETLTKEDKAQFEKGEMATVEGMLALAGEELVVVLGVIPASEPEMPEIAKVEIIAGPVNLSNNPQGYRGWAWPRIFIHNGKVLVTYLGIVNDWEARWLIEFDGINWSKPREILNGNLIIKNDKAYILSPVQGVEKSKDLIGGGAAGVVLNLMDYNLEIIKSITLDKTPTSHDVDQNPKAVGKIDSQGNLNIIWERDTKTATDIYYSKYDGEKFTEPVSVSKSPEIGSVNPSIAIDGNDILYAFWGEFTEGMYGGDIDIYYSFMEGGNWSEPKNLSNNDDWMEYMALPFGNSEVHTFYMPISKLEPGQTREIIINKDKIISDQKINFGFGDIKLIYDGECIYAVYGGVGPVGGEEEMAVKGYVYYNYYDGKEWGAGRGVDILPKEFVDNAELLKIDISSVGSNQQAKVILENGEKDLLREIHPYTVYKDGIIHVVFEYNQNGTYDAYYMAIKKSSEAGPQDTK